MADQEQLDRLEHCSRQHNDYQDWNRWRQEHPDVYIDLSGAELFMAQLKQVDLHGADLSQTFLNLADLRDVNFSQAHFMGACLTGANICGACLVDADLSNADINGAFLNSADLSGANLLGANLSNTNLSFAKLDHADLSYANLSFALFNGTRFDNARLAEIRISCTTFASVNLSTVHGLETVDHGGPSTIGIDTLYRSRGRIPDGFLRGCGLSDEMIGFAHSLAGAIQYLSIFISYNHTDELFASRLYNDLQVNNVRCWKYTEDVKIGDKIQVAVDQAIHLHDKLLVIFSEHSVQSDWIADEVEAALRREECENRLVLFPVAIDDAIHQVEYGWARKVRRHRNIGDFTAWKDPDHYQSKFERLLRDLKQAPYT